MKYKLLKKIEKKWSLKIGSTFQIYSKKPLEEKVMLDSWDHIPLYWLIEHWYIEPESEWSKDFLERIISFEKEFKLKHPLLSKPHEKYSQVHNLFLLYVEHSLRNITK